MVLLWVAALIMKRNDAFQRITEIHVMFSHPALETLAPPPHPQNSPGLQLKNFDIRLQCQYPLLVFNTELILLFDHPTF